MENASMKNVCVAVAIAGFALAGVSNAIAADQAIDITATVDNFCTIAGNTTALPATFPGAMTTAGIAAAGVQTVNIGQVECNGSSRATLISTNGALEGSNGGYLSYTATTGGLTTNQATVDASNTDGNTVTGAAALNTGVLSSAAVTVDIDLATPGTTPLNGVYTDTLTLRIQPQ
jgi:hypothetical protein